MSYPSFDVDKKYNVLQNIGKGSAGNVFLCKSKRDFKSYALKQIFLDKRKKSRSKDIVLREVLILQKLDHPHVVRYHEAFFDRKQDNLFIIQDYCARGSLYERVKTSRQKGSLIPERQIMEWFVQITMALRYIHGKRVLHRDLKTQNVFLTKTNMIKIGDFGIARVLEHTVDMASTCVGTPCYLSPEICQDKPYNSKSDIWALGCLLYELCAQKPAFNASNLVSLCYKIVKGSYEEIPGDYSNLVKMLIQKSLHKSPESRPTATAILNLPEVKEQLSVYITDKETERQSAHPVKREVGNNKNKRTAARPSVVNIGTDNKKKMVKKTKKSTPTSTSSSTGAVRTPRKKKKKTKAEVQDAEDVKKLPDEMTPCNRPVPPGRIKDPFKPNEDLPPILKHSALIGYSPPTIRRDDPPPPAQPAQPETQPAQPETQPLNPAPLPSPRSYINEEKSSFISNFSTVTCHDRVVPPPPPAAPSDPGSRDTRDVPRADSPPAPPKSTSPSFSNCAVVDSRTYAKPPSTPLYRIPKPNRSLNATRDTPQRISAEVANAKQQDDVVEKQNGVAKQQADVAAEQQSPISVKYSPADDSVETDGGPEPHIAHPSRDSCGVRRGSPVRTRPESPMEPVLEEEEGEGEERMTGEEAPFLPPAGLVRMPECGATLELSNSGSDTIIIPFSGVKEAAQLLPGQVEVGWSVADEQTLGFIPEELDGQPVDPPHNADTIGFAVDDNFQETLKSDPAMEKSEDNLNLNLDQVLPDHFPNIPGNAEDNQDEDTPVTEDDYDDYSSDFEEYEEIPDFENVEDIPDITAPGITGQEENEADSDEEDEQLFEMAMKSAKVALDNIEEEDEEEFVEDFVIPSSAGNIAALRQFCIDTLGLALFQDVQHVCREFEDNYDSHQTFLKKLEKLAGPEKLEICLIVDEFFADE